MPAAVITFSTSQLQRSLLKLRKMLTRLGRLNLLYTVLIFLNHFAYVSWLRNSISLTGF